MSSYPIIAISSGTRNPAVTNPCNKPIASRSFVANTAVGRSVSGIVTISSAAVTPEATSRCGVDLTKSRAKPPLCRDLRAQRPTADRRPVAAFPGHQ